ncbi:hypothetical protein N177_3642 [Lutibaculum baratangense AMV1]|uniref:VWA domain-containing protein n=1 Tax=Lutibaculum baratangense AMV1 TaxID=631454 RepID=V4RDW5_9HYPH|nr:hypothetical protein N177_3642 [Lutibaculum baratangense AMV1]
MRTEGLAPAEASSRAEIDLFLELVRRAPATPPAGERGRLVFALDATMSRQPTWDRACRLQAEMFQETASIGGLSVQLVYFRGFNECRASKWTEDATRLADLMSRIDCRGGTTQIRKVLRHARDEAGRKPVQALVYVGDCMEENVDELCALAGELGMLRVPAFMFHEGREPTAERAFREIARLTSGAYCSFDSSSSGQLRELLRAVAVYAAGGRKALARYGDRGAQLLLEQLK